MSVKPFPKQIFTSFRIDDYQNFTTQEINKEADRDITELTNKLSSSTLSLGTSKYTNFNTETNPLHNWNIKANSPIKLPVFYSNHWTQNLLNCQGYQDITINTSGCVTMSITIKVLKFSGLIYLFFPSLNFTPTSTNTMTINLSSYTELLPDFYVTETVVNINNTAGTGQQGVLKFDTNLILTLSTYISLAGNFLISNNYTTFSCMLIYKCSKIGY